MNIKYLCNDCCELLKINNNEYAVNEVCRKRCSRCGTNADWRMHVMSDREYTEAMLGETN
jgi:hypothetical protein